MFLMTTTPPLKTLKSVARCRIQALIEVSLLFGVYSTDMLKCLLNIYALGEYLKEKQTYNLLQF